MLLGTKQLVLTESVSKPFDEHFMQWMFMKAIDTNGKHIFVFAFEDDKEFIKNRLIIYRNAVTRA